METILLLTGIAILQSPLILKGDSNFVTSKNNAIIIRRGISVLLMLPFLYWKTVNTEIQLSVFTWFLLYFNVNLLLSLFQSSWYKLKAKENLLQQVQLENQPVNLHVINAVSWILYITAYEMLLRVIFINELSGSGFTYLQAAIISFVVYVVMHVPQGLKITAASFVFGVMATLWLLVTTSVIPVIILHIVCALGNDYIKLRKSENSASRIILIS